MMVRRKGEGRQLSSAANGTVGETQNPKAGGWNRVPPSPARDFEEDRKSSSSGRNKYLFVFWILVGGTRIGSKFFSLLFRNINYMHPM